MFTGDRSGDWLYASMWRCGYANQPHSTHSGDGLQLSDAYIAAAVRCAPPANKPTPQERDRCLAYLTAEIPALDNLKVVVALGLFAWDAVLRVHQAITGFCTSPKPRFGHLAEARFDRFTLLGSYHPSQQNTFTGKLTEDMMDAVFVRARELS